MQILFWIHYLQILFPVYVSYFHFLNHVLWSTKFLILRKANWIIFSFVIWLISVFRRLTYISFNRCISLIYLLSSVYTGKNSKSEIKPGGVQEFIYSLTFPTNIIYKILDILALQNSSLKLWGDAAVDSQIFRTVCKSLVMQLAWNQEGIHILGSLGNIK